MSKRMVVMLVCAGLLVQACQARGQSPADAGKAVAVGPAGPSWTKPSDTELRKQLTPLQYQVTQHEATEQPFHNLYWNNHAAGIYVDIVSGEPLFSSLDKFHSGTGWPSFTKPLEPGNITRRADHQMLEARIEIRSAHGGSHLGHVFNDGPPPTGLRYCTNSAALRFIPVAQLKQEGHGKYLALFTKSQ